MNSKSNNRNVAIEEPWHRVGMVWVMIGLPAIVVVASLLTVVIAHKNAPILNSTEHNKIEVSR